MAVAVLSEYLNTYDFKHKKPSFRETFSDIAECISMLQTYIEDLVMPYDVLKNKLYYTIDIMDFNSVKFTSEDRAIMDTDETYNIANYHYDDGILLASWTYETLSGQWRDYIKLH